MKYKEGEGTKNLNSARKAGQRVQVGYGGTGKRSERRRPRKNVKAKIRGGGSGETLAGVGKNKKTGGKQDPTYYRLLTNRFPLKTRLLKLGGEETRDKVER